MVELLILAVSVFASVIIGSFVFLRSPRRPINQVYGLLTFSFIVLAIANYFTLSPSDYALTAIRIVVFTTTIATLSLFLLVTMLQPDRTRVLDQKINRFLVFLSLGVAFLDLTPFVFSGLSETASKPTPVPGSGAFIFLFHFVGLIITSLIVVAIGIRNNTGIVRTQYTYFVLGIIPILLLAPITSFVLPVLLHRTEFIALTPLYLTFFVLMIAYAIVRHRLFDIRLAAVRSAAYGLVLLTLAGIYYCMAYIVSITLLRGQPDATISLGPINIALALLLAFLFQPIKRFFDRITNDFFYRDRYRSEDFFAQLSSLLTSTTDLRGLLERASEQIALTFKTDQAFFFLYYANAINHHMSAGTKGHNKLPVYDARMLDAFTANKNDAVILTESLPEDSTVRRMLVSHKIGLVMPLKRESTVVGYLLLGDQMSEGYKTRDVRVLMTVADELVIAIQNALSLHEIKEINSTLQQRIDSATKELRSSNSQLRHLDEVKDEFISMASHQLRTPLTSVKGYISMMLEGDTGQISPQQRKALEEAFNSSERMVRLISDFLNVSRLQTGKFVIDKAPTDIARIVKTEVDSLRVIAATHDLKLVFHPPKDLPTMDLDEGKVRQVIMNFIDNAIYYSRTKSNVTIKLERIEDDVAFTVTDTGIGVPADEQPKLFNKFFRAKNARQQRPDGTGVGLYLARKVVTAHGGKIVFNSVENVGSTFGFRIPINQLKK